VLLQWMKTRAEGEGEGGAQATSLLPLCATLRGGRFVAEALLKCPHAAVNAAAAAVLAEGRARIDEADAGMILTATLLCCALRVAKRACWTTPPSLL
jgi:hypothetical protein